MPKRREVAMLSRTAMPHDDASRSDRRVRDGDVLWILYAVIGWAVAYLLYLSSSSTFQLGL
jgi:hypothetical protein